jgi:hypothetical protein
MESVRNHSAIVPMICGPLSIILMLSGCNSKKEAVLATAGGIVKVNGQPAANIMVQFLPKVKEGDPGPTSTAISDEYGAFELATDDGKLGAVVGPCKVLFIDTAEERVPQGKESPPPRIPSSISILGPRTQEVEVRDENPPFEFDIKN